MSVHLIYKQNGAKFMRPVLSREEYLALRNGDRQQANLSRIRKGEVQLKSELKQFNYSCLPNEDGSLKGATDMSSTVGMDIDFKAPSSLSTVEQRVWLEMQMEKVPALVKDKMEELGLLMLERSATKGYHLVFKRRAGMTQEENLVWASNLLGVEFDKGAKDITRVFFTTTANENELLYLDDEIFELEKCVDPAASEPATESAGKESMGEAPSAELPSFKGIPYKAIIDEWWRQQGGKPEEGERNTELHRLAVHLRTICDNNQQLLLQIMPNFGLDGAEMQRIVASATKDQPKGKTQEIRAVLKALEQERGQQTIVGGQLNEAPKMPTKLPSLVKLLVSKTPENYKPAVAHAVFPALATHLCEVRFTYTDNVEHEATLMNCLMADTGTGKGCIDKPIERIMADIKHRDKENEKREAEWKKDCQKKGANKDKMLRPEGLVIQIIDPDMTKPALVTRMDEAEGHFVYVKLNELDLFEQLKGQTGKQHFQLMCLAFDPGAEYGQTRVGTQSVTARPQCRFNWNACTTIQKGRRFFSHVLLDGPISRINFCTIPAEEIGAAQPIYGQYDAAFDEALKPYIDNLNLARGLIRCPQADKLIKQLQEECAEVARLTQSKVYWNLSHRACVIAWLKACVLYVANGMKWERSFEDFIRWSLQYDLWCKMQFFGEDIEHAMIADERIGQRGPRNLLELLPETFTVDDAMRVRKQQGIGVGNTQNMLSAWKSRGYIKQMTDDSFQKSGKFRRIESI